MANPLPIEEYFKSHPIVTEERKRKQLLFDTIGGRLSRIIITEVTDVERRRLALLNLKYLLTICNDDAMIEELESLP